MPTSRSMRATQQTSCSSMTSWRSMLEIRQSMLVVSRKTELEAAEREAAERIFGLLPAEQATRFRDMWLEFEAGQSAEARFAKALDRLQPLLLNIAVGGGTWKESGVTEQQVIERYGPAIKGGSTALWNAARELVRTHFSASVSG